jgi:DNA-binding MarR family transcriptional regulator
VPRASSNQIRRERYLAFAEWRLGVQRARGRRKTVKYFRLTTHHVIIWTMIMRGYYAGRPPSLNDCLRAVTCAAETARKIIFTAEAKGYLEFRRSSSDHRKKLIYPSPQSITEYEHHVDTFLQLSQELERIRRHPAG